MKDQFLLLDVDGVLLDWQQGFLKYLRITHAQLIPTAEKQPGETFEDWLQLSNTKVSHLVQEFHKDPSFGELHALPGAIKAISILQNFFHLVLITACGTHTTTKKLRSSNLQEVFGDCFAHMHCTDTFAEKETHLRKYPTSWWIEDHLMNAQLGAKCGHRAVLIDYPYNQSDHTDHILRFKNLCDAGAFILSQARSSFPQ